MRAKVGIWSCPREAEDRYGEVLDQAIAALGGWEKFIKPGDLVLIKANEFIAEEASSGKTTHPALVLAAAKAARRAGAGRVVVGELNDNIFANFGPYPEIYDYAEVVNFGSLPHQHMQLPGAQSLKSPVPVPEIVKQCDVFINMPGLRTHALPFFSNAMKNLMGLLSLGSTSQVHMWGLEGSVVDLNAFRPSDLVITDALWSLQGNFPAEGDPLPTDLIVVGDNALAVDLVAAKLMKLDPDKVEYLVEGRRRGLGPAAFEEIKIQGDKKELLKKGITFVMPTLEYTNVPAGMRIVDKGICRACRRALASGHAAAQNNPDYKDPENLLAVVGPVEKLEHEPGEKVLLVGNCTAAHRASGRIFLPGCPPLAGQCRAALLSLKPDRFKTSYCSIALRDLPLEEVIEKIGPLGYDGLEIWGPHLEDYLKRFSMDELLAALAKYQLKVPMISPYFNLVSSQEELERSRQECKRFIGYAKALGRPLIRVFTGPAGSLEAAHWQWRQAARALKEFAQWGQEEGIGFAVETHQGQLADTTRSTLRLVLQVDEENFGVNLDIHNLFAVGEDPISALRLLAPYVVHVHAKNADETSRKYGVPLAKGNMDYAPFLWELSEIGYDGYVSIEWFGEGAVENAASELAFLRKFQVLVG